MSYELIIHKDSNDVYAAKKFTVSPKSKASKKYCNSKLYTSKTRIYFAIRERLEKLEKSGGGTLVFKKGTYVLTNALYVPSNVKIILSDGVTINKGKNTGVKGWAASKSLFQLIKPSKSKKSNVYGKYNSSRNVTFEGKGKAVINLKYYKNNHGIMAAHNSGLTIKNITFKNMNGGHFIELNSNQNVTIENCKFLNSKGSLVKEAINLDTPDKKTGGWDQKWSKFDRTACNNVRINNCYFSNLGHAVGTHKYSYNHEHENIQITNCTMVNIKQEGIRMQNWNEPVIKNNIISGTGKKSAEQAIIGRGVTYPVIESNKISKFTSYVIRIRDGWNVGGGSDYPKIYSYLTDQNFTSLMTNTVSNMNTKTMRIETGRSMNRVLMDLN